MQGRVAGRIVLALQLGGPLPQAQRLGHGPVGEQQSQYGQLDQPDDDQHPHPAVREGERMTRSGQQLSRDQKSVIDQKEHPQHPSDRQHDLPPAGSMELILYMKPLGDAQRQKAQCVEEHDQEDRTPTGFQHILRRG